jgi:hypothetical protein
MIRRIVSIPAKGTAECPFVCSAVVSPKQLTCKV